MTTCQVGHHEVALRIWKQDDEVKFAVHFALDATPGGLQLVCMWFPGLLTGETSGEMIQRRMFSGAQEKHTAFSADFGIHIKGVDEGVERVLGV